MRKKIKVLQKYFISQPNIKRQGRKIMTEFIRTEKKNGKRFSRAIAVAIVCVLLFATLALFAACGGKTLYTYEQVMSGTYVLTETDDETLGKTLKEIVAELEDEFDFKRRRTKAAQFTLSATAA